MPDGPWKNILPASGVRKLETATNTSAGNIKQTLKSPWKNASMPNEMKCAVRKAGIWSEWQPQRRGVKGNYKNEYWRIEERCCGHTRSFWPLQGSKDEQVRGAAFPANACVNFGSIGWVRGDPRHGWTASSRTKLVAVLRNDESRCCACN